MIIKTIAATTNETEDPFSKEDLQKLADTANGCPVLLDFNEEWVVGRIIFASVTTEGLEITAEIDDIHLGMNYLVPGYIHPETKSVCYGLVQNAQDLTLSEIKI